MSVRVGIGYDSHRYASGRKLRLGGVTIPHTHGLAGHSDGDAVLHAIIDALLGATALGDIGTYFPDNDPKWKDADSAFLVKETVDAVKAGKWAVHQVDVTVVLERPKLAPHIGQMRAATARALGIAMEHVSIKAKTNEGMGWIGRNEGVGCVAVATVKPAGS